MTAKEIKNYIDMMKHTLNRRMDSQAGKEELIKEYTEKMEQGLNAIEELEAIKSADSGEAMEELQLLKRYGNDVKYAMDKYRLIEKTLLKSQQQAKELAELKKSDESKEQSSIDYYNEMKKYKKELEELKKSIALLKEYYECTDWIEFERLLNKLCKGD